VEPSGGGENSGESGESGMWQGFPQGWHARRGVSVDNFVGIIRPMACSPRGQLVLVASLTNGVAGVYLIESTT
jgi:hypothetical protein